MFSQPVIRGGRRIGQIARGGQQPSLATLKGAGQRRCYAEVAQAAPKGRVGRGLGLILYGVAFGGIGAAATWYSMVQKGFASFTDAETAKLFVPDTDEVQRIEDTINNHPLVKELRSRPEFKESRPHLKMSQGVRSQSLTAGVLQGDGKMVVPPVAFIEDGGKSIVSITYIGDQLCGHPGLVHGGFLATMLDEGMARGCFGALPHNIAVTASLEINYRKPTQANSFLVLRGTTVKVDGRKAWAEGRIETLPEAGEEPTVLVEAKGLFISPKYAALMPRIT
ncbi:thioesterase family [Trichoderma arundinaceum]|uniref:Thioesterase family n=1 Tax=Trichoderma arundinaceum TaxID=490622 RepID=A0A395NLP7_TRIAR|nr:thioesterase family [Trichoderma arundinaceum]